MKKLTRCVFSGSFDPFTAGHLDLAERASGLFDVLDIVVLHNPEKHGLLDVSQRLELIRAAVAHLPDVEVHAYDGLLVDYIRETNATAILRGIRNITDYESETTMARINKMLNPQAETLFMPCDPLYAACSSSAVKEIASFGGDYTKFIPKVNLDAVKEPLESLRRKNNGNKR